MLFRSPFMSQALELAASAAERGEVPVGALIVREGRVIATATNAMCNGHDPTAHAEMLVIQAACKARGSKYLQDCTLVVTLEPCAMCAQAASLAKVKKVIFGAFDPKGGGVEHGARVFSQPTCHHAPEVIGGVQAEECGALLVDFFKARR